MNAITELIYQTVIDDATFKTVTGADASDPRCYYAYPWEQRAISRSKPSYVTYYVGASGGMAGDEVAVAQLPDQTYVFDIWSRSPGQARLVEERIMELLHSKKFETADYLGVYLKLDARNEMGEADIKGAETHVNMRFTLGPFFRKAGGFYSYT